MATPETNEANRPDPPAIVRHAQKAYARHHGYHTQLMALLYNGGVLWTPAEAREYAALTYKARLWWQIAERLDMRAEEEIARGWLEQQRGLYRGDPQDDGDDHSPAVVGAVVWPTLGVEDMEY